MKGAQGEVASKRWFDDDCQWTMFNKLQAALASLSNAINEDKDGGFFICAEAGDVVKASYDLLEELAILECNRKREFLDVQCYDAIAAMRERDAAVVVFAPHELRGANAERVADRLTEIGWEIIDDLALFPHTVACEHCGTEFESSEADYDDTLAGTAIVCPNCGGYNLSTR